MTCMSSVKRGSLEKGLSEQELASRLLNCECGQKEPRQSDFPRQWFPGISPTSRYIRLAEHMSP